MTDPLQASRKGGARLERQEFGRNVVIHNYGAGGAGYQASWYARETHDARRVTADMMTSRGMAKEAVGLLGTKSRL